MPTRNMFANLQGGAQYKFGSDVNNEVPARNVYGAATGNTLGQVSAAMNPASLSGANFSEAPTNADVPIQGAEAPQQSGALGSPVVWLVILALLIVGFRFLAKRGGEGAQFANLKVTIWNVLLITLVAVVGLAFLKVVLAKIRIPGLTELVHAA